jgi:hypothetical protein
MTRKFRASAPPASASLARSTRNSKPESDRRRGDPSSAGIRLAKVAAIVDYCCVCCFTVDDSFLTTTPAGASGLEESVFTSTLRELVDSVVELGAGAGAACVGAATGAAAAAAVGGACWQPVSVRPKVVMVKAARSLQLFGFICVNLFLVAVAAGRCVAVRGSYFSNRRPAALLRESGLTVRGQ